MQTADWLSALRQAANEGCRQVQFIGGEPTLHPDLPQMIETASQLDYDFIEVFTNANSLTNQLLETFVKYSVHVAVSFYTDQALIHDSITERPGSFNRTVLQIERLLAAGLRVRAGVIELAPNLGHAQQAKAHLERLGVTDIKIDGQRGVGRSTLQISSREPMSQLCGECWKGKLCITPTGSVYPCVFSRFAEVGKATDTISRILRNDPLQNFRQVFSEYCNTEAKHQRTINTSPDAALQHECDPTCAPCGPVSFCVPARTCNPETRCGPDIQPQPCAPERRCAPNIQGRVATR